MHRVYGTLYMWESFPSVSTRWELHHSECVPGWLDSRSSVVGWNSIQPATQIEYPYCLAAYTEYKGESMRGQREQPHGKDDHRAPRTEHPFWISWTLFVPQVPKPILDLVFDICELLSFSILIGIFLTGLGLEWLAGMRQPLLVMVMRNGCDFI